MCFVIDKSFSMHAILAFSLCRLENVFYSHIMDSDAGYDLSLLVNDLVREAKCAQIKVFI
jgi:hypothetical protein